MKKLHGMNSYLPLVASNANRTNCLKNLCLCKKYIDGHEPRAYFEPTAGTEATAAVVVGATTAVGSFDASPAACAPVCLEAAATCGVQRSLEALGSAGWPKRHDSLLVHEMPKRHGWVKSTRQRHQYSSHTTF